MLGLLIARVQKIAVAVKSALLADGITILQYNEPAGGQIVFATCIFTSFRVGRASSYGRHRRAGKSGTPGRILQENRGGD